MWDDVVNDWVPVEEVVGAMEVPASSVFTGEGRRWVYDLVVPGASGIIVGDGFACLTLGHGVDTGRARHDVLGDLDMITWMIEGIAIATGVIDGRPVPVAFVRNPTTGWITGLAAAKEKTQ